MRGAPGLLPAEPGPARPVALRPRAGAAVLTPASLLAA